MRHIESSIQCGCVAWYRLQYPELGKLLVACPNGSKRPNAITGAILKREGVVAGVADLLLFVARGGYHGLHIEMKTEKGRQSDAQKAWQSLVEAQGYKYIICRSVEEFVKEVGNYMENKFSTAPN